MTLAADQQAAHLGRLVSLYTIDATPIGGQQHRFVSGRWRGADVTFDGADYTSTPIEVEGIEYGGDGAVARPKLTISRLDETLVSGILLVNNWRGAKFTRLRTLAKYLDDEPDADPTRHWPLDVYRIERREKETKTEIVFQLASPLDFDKKQLPGRQVLRDICSWQYRRWDGAKFVYAHEDVACPYRGNRYFDGADAALNDEDKHKDKCSQRVTGCLARFPDRVLPFGGFIGVGRFRRS